MVILGPWPRILVTATQTPATAATIGTSHTSERRVRRLATARASGTGGSSGISHLSRALRIPDEPRVEGLDREHGQHHDGREERQAGPRLDRHERLELDERRGER